jgi:uncharacterized membrane protein
VNGSFVFIAAFLASAVESVEMAAILVGVGETRGWKSAWFGAIAGFAVLAGVVIGMGAALEAIPIAWLRLIVGTLLLIFGLQWLKKAIVRIGSGYRKHFDVEDDADVPARPGEMDWYGFVLSFKGVLLEGLEIAFVVVSFGSEANKVTLSSIAAVCAFCAVAGVAIMVHRWLANIPREWLRFGVGVLLSAFGTFWSAEGSGVRWPGQDVALLALLFVIAGVAFALIAGVRRATRSSMMPAEQVTS